MVRGWCCVKPDVYDWAHRVVVDVDCWLWSSGNPYGKVPMGYQPRLAHRYVYTQLVGPCPNGLVSDHLCKRQRCVNPDHIEFVTVKVNQNRSAMRHACKRGHRRLPSNLTKNGECLICNRAASRKGEG
jgi:hypothetical protein